MIKILRRIMGRLVDDQKEQLPSQSWIISGIMDIVLRFISVPQSYTVILSLLESGIWLSWHKLR